MYAFGRLPWPRDCPLALIPLTIQLPLNLGVHFVYLRFVPAWTKERRYVREQDGGRMR